MTALLLHTVLGWLHDQVEQTVTGAATPLRPRLPVPVWGEPPDVVDAEWVDNGPS